MAMPKAAVYKYDFLAPRKDQIGLTGQATVVKSVSKSFSMQQTAQRELRLSILRPYLCHMRTSLFGGHEVDHYSMLAPRDKDRSRLQRRASFSEPSSSKIQE